MTTAESVLWRSVLTASTLLLLASCGIEQSTPRIFPTGTAPVVSPSATLASPSLPLPSLKAPSTAPFPASTIAPAPSPSQPNQLTVTMAENGKTIPLVVGQTLLLTLAPDYKWTVTVDDPGTIRQVQGASGAGTQGRYQAVKSGTTGLHATGVIICPPGKACIQIALEFSVQLVVK